MKNNFVAMASFFLAGELCLAAVPDQPFHATEVKGAAVESTACDDMQSIINSLRVQRFEAEGEFDVKELAESEVLKLLGVHVIPTQSLYFEEANRVSGECVSRLDAVSLSNYHFDTGLALILTRDGVFIPHPRRYTPKPMIGQDDPHPERELYQFVGAVEIGWGYFVGIWERDGKSVMTYYRKMPTGEFRIQHDMLESETKILAISRFPALDSPSFSLQIVLQDKNDRTVLDFIWFLPPPDKIT